MAQPILCFQRRTPTQLWLLALCGALSAAFVFLYEALLPHKSPYRALPLVISILFSGMLTDWAAEAHLKRGVKEGWWRADLLDRARKQNDRFAAVFVGAGVIFLAAWLVNLCFYNGHFAGLMALLLPTQVVSRVGQYLGRPSVPLDAPPDRRTPMKPIVSERWGEGSPTA